MRPVRLEIHGLASFRALQKVDFSGLDLFVITGPTGAGKTSILDAIALALYGEIPRTGKKNAAELVTHGDTRARVLLEFQADGQTYRVARQLPRSGAQKATLERLAGDHWVTEVEESGVRPINARIEAIIGLDFEAFTRAVLLPQGDFARFLGGDAKQRREILVRLLDLGRFETAGQLARQQADRLNNEISSKEQLIAHEYAEAREDTVAAAADEAAKAEGRAAALEKARAEVERAAEGLAEVQRRLAEIDRDAVALRKVGQALAKLKVAWTSLEPRVVRQLEAVHSATADVKGAETAHQEAAANLEITRARTGEERLLVALEGACAAATREGANLADLTTKIASAREEISGLDTALAKAVAVQEVARAQDEAAGAAEEALNKETSRIADKVRKARDRADAERTVTAATAEDTRARAALETHHQALRAAEAEAAQAAEHLAHLKGEHAAIAIRAGLTIGGPCPVCLHPVGEIPVSPADVESSIATAKADADAARRCERSAQTQANEAASEAKTAERMLAEATKCLEGLADAPALTTAEAEAGALNGRRARVHADRAAAAKAVDNARARHSELAAKLAAAQAHLHGLTRERDGVQERLCSAQEQLEAAFPTGTPKDAAPVIAERRHDFLTARQTEESARARFDQARRAHDRIARSGEQLDREVAQFMQGCAEQRGVLSQLSADRNRRTSAELTGTQRAIADEIVVLSEWTRVAEAEYGWRHSAEEEARKSRAADLTRAAAAMGISLSSPDPTEIRAAAQKAITESVRAAQRTANKLTDLRARLVRRQELEAQIAESRARARLYHALAGELRQNRFIDYVLGESMRQLATLASLELRNISAGRYSLSAEETSFVVIDHANADETRSVATLSGGETFLASLSLAVALAQSITDIAGEALGSRLEAMFIDEGFGGLDSETLDVVIDALERLRDSERMVGVITHVSQLAERIPDGLVVERQGTTSQIRPR